VRERKRETEKDGMGSNYTPRLNEMNDEYFRGYLKK